MRKANKCKYFKHIFILLIVVFMVFSGGGCDTDTEYTQLYESYDSVDFDDSLRNDVVETNKTADKVDENETVESSSAAKESVNTDSYKVKLGAIPEFDDSPYVTVNNNIPGLIAENRDNTYFENYSPLDYLGRCTTVYACLGKETMPTEERGEIGYVKPTGWHTVKYDCVDGKYLYNRCHLIGFQLSGENANTRNLITGTRYMNVEGMLPFENMVADYIKETDNHVLYRVTPIFKGDELLARGVQIEAYSVEDNGDGICFNVFCYNNQPGVVIEYTTGDSYSDKNYHHKITTENQTTEINDEAVWLPRNGKCYHKESDCSGMNSTTKVTMKEAKAMGYRPCGRCC